MMMAENPKYWWSLNGSSSLPLNTSDDHNHHNQDLPLPWSQQLLTEEGRRLNYSTSSSSAAPNPDPNPNPNIDEYSLKKLEKKWADNDNDQSINNDNYRVASDRVNQETNFIRQSSIHNQQVMYNTTTTIGHGDDDDNDNCKVEGGRRRPCWMMPVLVSSMSPTYSYRRRSSSCNTSLSTSSSTTATNNIYLDFSTNQLHNQHPILDHHSSISHLQCSDSLASSGPSKKARVQPSSTQHPPLKVRKEKLGDRITALHQLVSPFGKTDTASVLLEAIGYIRFLEAQIQALSSPYLGNVSSGSMRIQQSAPVKEKRNCIVTGRSDPPQDSPPKDLRSRGLRLVQVDCAHHINTTNGSDIKINVPDYWASSAGGAGGF